MKKFLVFILLIFCSWSYGQIRTNPYHVRRATASDPLAEDWIVFLPMTETSGTTAYDAAGGDKDFTITNAIPRDTGLYFDGDQDYARRTYDADIGALGSSFSFSVWINVSDFSTNGRMAAQNNTATPYRTWYCNVTSAGALSFYLYTASAVTASSTGVTMSTNIWYHVAAVYNGSTMHVYINGVDRTSGTASQTGNIATSNTYMYIGNLDGSANDFPGLMRGWGINDKAFTADQIQDLYELGRTYNPF